MRMFSYKQSFVFLLILLFFLAGCATEKFPRPDIKDDFCGVHINYQYCKCAFHKEYCDNIGMSKSEANTHVRAEYNAWVDELYEAWKTACTLGGGIPENDKCIKKEGVIEKDGKLYLNSKPGEVLSITNEDLPVWARGQLVVVGAMAICVGPPDNIRTGDDTVLLNGLPVARLGDNTEHGGKITDGSSKIFINGVPAAFVGGMHVCPMITPPVPHVGGPIATTGY